MNSCCTIPATKLDAASPAAPTARRPFFAFRRLISNAAFTAVDLTQVFLVDPDRPAESAPRRTYCETR